MKDLPQRDYRAILDFLNDINDLQTHVVFLNKVITGLQTIVEGDIVTCFESGPTEKDHVVCFSDSQYVKYFTGWMRTCNDHPAWEHLQRSGDCGWYGISDYLSESAFHRTALYNEVWRHPGIEDNLGTLAIVSPQVLAAVSINRRRRTFKERDRQALNLLQPHLIQAWRNTRRAEGLHEQINSYAATLESRTEGIVILDGKQKVRLMTAKALRFTGKYFSALGADDSLPKRLHDWVCSHHRSPQNGLATAPRRPWVIEHADGSDLTVTCVPCCDGAALILQERPVACNLAILGLSRRESDVLLWVTRGKSNEEIGIILGMSLGTVKKHLEHIFQKLGVESRTAAAARALSEAAA
jgi:DNA-binding CsgD family transcriptional regulator/PAS domain-containing protein